MNPSSETNNMEKESAYTKALHAFLGLLLTALSALIIQVYSNLEEDVAGLDNKFDQYTIRATNQSRSADNNLAQFTLIIEKKLENLTVRVDHLEEEVEGLRD